MADQAPTPFPGMFNPNRPRIRLAEDELGRKGFVRSFWSALRNHDASEALVISVQAPWGDGKTTFKNMVVDLEGGEGEPKKLLFVHFNPWEWAAQNQVAAAFFEELARQIEGFSGKGVKKQAKEILGKVVRQLPRALGLAEVTLTAMSVGLLPFNPVLAGGAAAAANVVKTGKEGLEQVGKHHAGSTATDTPSLQSVKDQVREQFKSFKKETDCNIVVFIDDIDRLSGDEIRHVLQLVKINADFPGLIFVLLFDREYVERRLRRQFGSDAARFLEKIVQVELALPKASEVQLYTCFKRDVGEVLKKRLAYQAIFEEDRLKQAFDVWFRFHLINPRKSGRLLSSWAFRLDVFNSDAAEVNPVDLLILEGLLLYEASVYQGLSESIHELQHINFEAYMHDELNERDRPPGEPSKRMQLLNELAERAKNSSSSEAKEVVKLLLGVSGSDFVDVSAEEESERTCKVRFSQARFARRYFRLSIDSGDVSRATIRKLANLIGTPKDFLEQLTELETQGVLLDALDQLLAEDFTPPQDLSHFMAHLLDWWEVRVIGRGGAKADTGLNDSLIRLYEHLMGSKEGDARLGVLRLALTQTDSVFALQDLVFFEQGKRHQREEANSSDSIGLLKKDGEQELCEKVARRLHQQFKSDEPKGHLYEVEACRWALEFAGSWRREIGTELLRTAGGIVVLGRGILEHFGTLPSTNELRFAATHLEPMVEVKTLCQTVQQRLTELTELDARAEQWARTLDRIREAHASSKAPDASVDPTK